jgi:putative ABC transport system substrate-binding protein
MDRRRFLLSSLTGVLAAPVAVEGQQAGKVYRIGFLRPGPPPKTFVEAFQQGLRERGYVDGQNVVIEFRFGDVDVPEMSGKQLQMLQEIRPAITRVAVLGDPRINDLQFHATEIVAGRLGVTLQALLLSEAKQIPGLVAEAARQKAGALVALTSPIVNGNMKRLAAAALIHRLPTVSGFVPSFAEAGGLLAYGPDFPDLFRRAAGHIIEILRGARPGDLPVQRPTKFPLVINARTAKALGLTIPPSLLARADQVIE